MLRSTRGWTALAALLAGAALLLVLRLTRGSIAHAQEIEPGSIEWKNKPLDERRALIAARNARPVPPLPPHSEALERIAAALERIADAQEALAAVECARLSPVPAACERFR